MRRNVKMSVKYAEWQMCERLEYVGLENMFLVSKLQMKKKKINIFNYYYFLNTSYSKKSVKSSYHHSVENTTGQQDIYSRPSQDTLNTMNA